MFPAIGPLGEICWDVVNRPAHFLEKLFVLVVCFLFPPPPSQWGASISARDSGSQQMESAANRPIASKLHSLAAVAPKNNNLPNGLGGPWLKTHTAGPERDRHRSAGRNAPLSISNAVDKGAWTTLPRA